MNAPMPDKPRPVIRRVKKVAGGHHSSAWKIAFADFMTVMMAFFLVMWIVGLDDSIKSNVESYFNDPLGRAGLPAGAMIPSPGSSPGGTIAIIPLNADRGTQDEIFEEAKNRIEESLGNLSGIEELRDFIEITITDEGLLIEMIDAEESYFFETGSAQLKPQARRVFAVIAAELGRLPNRVLFEGHTDATPFRPGTGQSNWELSAERANAVRRVTEATGLRNGQVAEVRGYAAERLRNSADPHHFSNRRVSIIARYLEARSAADRFGAPAIQN
jgi:chemotaxis protein MotB